MRITVTVMTDKYPEENSWTLTNTCTGQGWASPKFDKIETKFETSLCAPASAKYTFEMRDNFGDGKLLFRSGKMYYPLEKRLTIYFVLPSIFSQESAAIMV